MDLPIFLMKNLHNVYILKDQMNGTTALPTFHYRKTLAFINRQLVVNFHKIENIQFPKVFKTYSFHPIELSESIV